MCTIGGLGWHIGWQSTDISVNYRSAIDRLLVDSRLIVDWYINRLSVDASADMYTFIGQPSVNYRSTIDRLLVDSRLIVDWYIDRLSVDASADMYTFIGQLSADISVHCRPIYRSTINQ